VFAPVCKGSWPARNAKRLTPALTPATGLFGREKDDWLEGSLSAMMQTFGEAEVYSGLEEKASHLLCFLIKNHRGEKWALTHFRLQ